MGLLFHLHGCPEWAVQQYKHCWYVNSAGLPLARQESIGDVDTRDICEHDNQQLADFLLETASKFGITANIAAPKSIRASTLSSDNGFVIIALNITGSKAQGAITVSNSSITTALDLHSETTVNLNDCAWEPSESKVLYVRTPSASK